MSKVDAQSSSVIVKVKSLLYSEQDGTPGSNQSLDASSCPHHRKSRLVHSILLVLLFSMAISIVTLKAITYDFVEDNRMTGFTFEAAGNSSSTREAMIMGALPQMLYTVPTKLAIIAAVILMSTAAGHLGFVIVDWKSGKRTQSYAFRRNMMFLHLSNAIFVLFALVSIYMTHKNSSDWDGEYVSQLAVPTTMMKQDPVFRYDMGTFDLETWACELKDVPGAAMVQTDYAKQCSVEVAGRAVMVPLVISAWLVAGASIWGFVSGGRKGLSSEQMDAEDAGFEMGQLNAL